MKIKTIGMVAAVVLIGTGITNAQVDFSKLLGSLNFADDQAAAQQAPAEPELQDNPVELPSPEEGSIPERLPIPMEEVQPNTDLSGRALNPQRFDNESSDSLRDLSPGSLDDRLSQDPLMFEPPAYEPQTQPLDYPQAIDSPALSSTDSVDLDQFADDLLPAPIRTNHLVSTAVAACGSGCATPCSTCGHRVGVTPPCLDHIDLPPPASLESFYRTPACYRGLWSGYGAQKAVECSKHHRHLHGTCDCARHSAAHNIQPGHCAGGCGKLGRGKTACGQVVCGQAACSAAAGCGGQAGGCASCGSH